MRRVSDRLAVSPSRSRSLAQSPARAVAHALCMVAACVVAAGAQWAKAPVIRPKIVAELPHDTAAFTQGLLWLDGKLFESTGLYGKSTLREVDPATGRTLRSRKLPDRYFAEGLVYFQGGFIQLTWREGVAFRYERNNWNSPKRLAYKGEGWGLTAIGDALWMSNGSDTLYRRDASFRVTGKTAVTLNGRPLARLNELEAVNGKILANVWYCDSLFVIDPAHGRVLAVVDGTELARRSGRRSYEDVLNGAAYDPVAKMFYLTGKQWPKMFKARMEF